MFKKAMFLEKKKFRFGLTGQIESFPVRRRAPPAESLPQSLVTELRLQSPDSRCLRA